MCFSSVASFSAAAVLGSVGLVSLKNATRKSQLLFAMIPVLFGIQQAIEGMLWLSFGTEHPIWRVLSTYAFLFFAHVLWCTWVPLSLLSLEKEPLRRKWLIVITIVGLTTSALLGYRLITTEVVAKIVGHHIDYDLYSTPLLSFIFGLLYLASVIVPCFVSGVKGLQVIGMLLILSLLVSRIFYREYLISVWCFFAAVLSVSIVYVMKGFQREKFSDKNFHELKL